MAIGHDQAAGDQIFKMSKDGQSGRLGQPRVQADIDRPHNGRNIRLPFGQPAQDGRFAGLTVVDVGTHEALRLPHRSTMARQIDRFRTRREFSQRCHVVLH